MKNVMFAFVLCLMVVGLSGCGEQSTTDQAEDRTTSLKEQADEKAKAIMKEDPAKAKPKDHPAH